MAKPYPLRRRSDAENLRNLIENSGKPRIPDFFGIGAEKCGTTWLWQMFREHPDIGVPLPKELRYFSHQYLGTSLINFTALRQLLQDFDKAPKGPRQMENLATELRMAFGTDESYLRVFGNLKGRRVGDISPQYCMLPQAGILHMQKIAPDAKIIFLIRDPVERVISAGKMKASEAQEEPTETLVRKHAFVRFQLEMSRDSAILDRFEAAFPNRVFVGNMDDIGNRPLGFLEDLCAFLGVGYDPSYFPNVTRKANEGKKLSISPQLRRDIYSSLKDEYIALAHRFPEWAATWKARHETELAQDD